jgi:glycosyltransferase involved in cell wall biosynthesis
MRILIWSDAFLPDVGGQEIFCMNLVRALHARGHECALVTNRDQCLGEQAGEFEGARVHAFAFRETLVRGQVSALGRQHRACCRIADDFQPDVIHLHGLSRSMFHFILQQNHRRRPAVATLHDNLVYRGPDTMAAGALAKVDRIAAVSGYLRGEALAYDPALASRLVTVRNALPPPVFSSPLPPATPRLLVPCRLVREKGIDLAIEAFFAIAPHFPEVTLTVAGDGPERGNLEARTQNSEFASRIFFPGLIAPENMPRLIGDHSVVLVPSRWQEPFGLAALEAAQMGRPVVASRAGGLPEIVVEGVTGLLHENGDLAGLAQALRRLLENRRECEQMGREAQARATAHFPFEKMIDHYEQLYLEAQPSGKKPGRTAARTRTDDRPPVIPLLWEAAPFAHHSFGVVSRETGRALMGRPEVDFTFVPYERDHFDPLDYPEYASLAAACSRNKARLASPLKPVLVRLQFPLRPLPPPGVHWVVYHPWEYSRAPIPSVAIMNRAKEVWTTSHFGVEAFVRSGVAAGKIHVIPNGVDLDIFRPAGRAAVLPTAKPFRFLFVGGTIFRKGVDLLLEAYGRAFTSADPVSLVIKDYRGNTIYPYERGAHLIAEFRKDASRPEVIHLPAHRNDLEMAELYRACDVFVSSYRGEGFCLPALEAMACGRPVIVTKGGSTDDFVPASAGWHIPATPRSFGKEVFEMPVVGEAELLEPDVDTLVELLHAAFHDPAAVAARGAGAAWAAHAWSWDAAAEKIITRCRAITALVGK